MNNTEVNKFDNDIGSVKYEKINFILRLMMCICSVFTCIIILVVALVVVPKAVNLMNTAQRTLNNMETVSEELKELALADTIKKIEDNTARAMSDVSNAMVRIEELDVATLNQSIQELKESTEKFNNLFSK